MDLLLLLLASIIGPMKARRLKTSQIASTLVSLAVYINPNNLDCVIATTQAERTSLEATGYVFREPIGYNSNI